MIHRWSIARRLFVAHLLFVLTLTAVVGTASLLTKAMFEDVLDKHRLSMLLGLLLGVMVTAGQAVREHLDVDEDAVAEVDVRKVVVAAEVPAWS